MGVPPRPTAAEFFAGIGLVRLALEQSGIGVTWANDVEACKRRVYAENFDAEHFVLADVRSVAAGDVPTVDLATASFPCTELSLAGNRGGLREGESSMFWEFARVLREMKRRRPRVILLENVPGFATSHGGRDLRDAVQELNGLGYSCDLLAINALRFVPQSRLRMFIVGIASPAAVPPPLSGPDDLRPDWIIDFIGRNQDLRLHSQPLQLPPPTTVRLSNVVERFPLRNGAWWDVERVARFVGSLSRSQHERLEALRGARRLSWRTAYRRTRGGIAVWEIRADAVAGCLRTARGGSSKQAVVEAGRGRLGIRWMTSREYATLQGAPTYRFASVTENKALFGFGDAVCVPVISWIAQNYLLPVISQQTQIAS